MNKRLTIALVMAMIAASFWAVPAGAADRFDDVPDDHTFHGDIGWLADTDITRGCNPPDNTLFCPEQSVTRGQIAAFFTRALGLTSTEGATDFVDVPDDHTFHGDIARLSAAGITRGCNPPDNDEFCPERPLTRGEMAAFFTRGLGLTSTDGATDFVDTDDSTFVNDIAKLSATGITRGCNPPDNDMYCPDREITRGEIAAFFHRADANEVNLQILGINDFHGNIATTGSWGPDDAPVGRADYFAAHVDQAEAGADHSILVSAGDLIGASPLISGLFHDEPTIEAMNLIGLELNGVGNHEFDEGSDELLRMQNGGTHPVDGNPDGDGFAGADFEFLSANVTVDATGETLFAPYSIKKYDGVEVAFIGMTLEGTPSIVTQEGVAGLTFHDEVESVNALVPELQDLGIEAIVVLLHEGGFSEGGEEGDDCEGGLTDPLNSIVTGFDEAVDVVIAGHVNDEFVCEVNGMWVTMADNAGRLLTDIDTTLNRLTGELTVKAIDNVPTYHADVPAAVTSVTDLIDEWQALADVEGNVVIGTIVEDIPENYDDSGETAIGNLIADAQLAATAGAGTGNAEVAFMNNGGVRTDDGFVFAQSGSEGDGNVTYAEAFAVQPFGNSLVTMTLTGQQIHDLLEQQFPGTDPGEWEILHVSEGFSYTWDNAGAEGDKVDPGDITIGGAPIELGTDYRVTVNSFLAGGGDGFSILLDGTDRLGGDLDLDAMVDYMGANPGLSAPTLDRIDVLNP
jgi:5'-nucleotidase